MAQPAQSDHSERRGAIPRLKDVSATVRRLSRPLSMVPERPASLTPSRLRNKLKKASRPNSVASGASPAIGPASSRRTSLLSTARSSVSRDDREPLGELPVFGVSQRAYLASLVSLFSNSKGRSTFGTPLSANTPITDPSSGAPSLGPYEFDIHSSAVYQYSKVRRLYVGWPGLSHPPSEALLEFEMETLPLLERDLQGISGYLGQQGIRITYELRMSGYASATAETVILAPTVWILYRASSAAGSQASVAELHQAVADIFYLKKGLEIQEGGGRIELTSDRHLVDVKVEEKEGIKLSDGAKLFIHVEDCQEKYSVCGALCCVTIEEDSKQVQSLCRIGGLLKVNGKYLLGVSTAHAMLDGSGIFRDSFIDTTESVLPPGQAVDRDEILSESNRVSKWHSVSRDAAVDFLGISMNSRGEMAINRSKPENATDFALLRLSKMPAYVRNKYIPPRSEDPVTITSTASASAAAMDEGPVYILCGGGDVADGQLVWGSACLIVRGRNFRVRRIQTSRPLSAGTTGAWVVRGEVLYGVIVAVYENEPFALMMTIERLFASILGSAFSIRSVELWDGETPESLPPKAQEAGKISKTTKNGANSRTSAAPRDTGNGEGSSKLIESINGNGPSNKSEGTQTVGPLPRTAEGGTQTEEPLSTNANATADAEKHILKSTKGPPSSRLPSRGKDLTSNASTTSDVSMSGAVRDSRSPPTSKGKERVRTGDSAVSAGAQTTYTTASESGLERQDSGFDSAAPPVQRLANISNGAGDETVRRGLQAPPILPAEKTGLAIRRGGVEWNGDFGRTSTKRSRRYSFQKIFGAPFRRSSSNAHSREENGDDHGLFPPISLGGRRTLSSRRRSAATDPNSVHSRDGASSDAPSGSDMRPSSSTQSKTARLKKHKHFTKDNNSGNSPGGLDHS